MLDCWINVYMSNNMYWTGGCCASVEQAEHAAYDLKPIYRIHVRMK